MPSSRPETIPAVINLVMKLQPRSILDVGMGFGKYGFLFREYLDIWNATTNPSKLARRNWQTRIDGIEAYAPYISDLQCQIYNQIFIGNALTEIDDLGSYELVFLGDVIEHLTKTDGHALLQKCLAHASRNALIVTPNYFNPQPPQYDNPLEKHLSLWTPNDMTPYPNTKCHTINNHYNIFLIPKALNKCAEDPPS